MDRVEAVASVPESELLEAQRDLVLDPTDPDVREAAKAQDIDSAWIEAAERSPAYKMFVDWQIALPLHPEFRTLPMLFYVPPESPMRSLLEADGKLSMAGESGDSALPELGEYRIPLEYLANLFAAGNTDEVEEALEKQLALRQYRRSLNVDGEPNESVLEAAGLTVEAADEMHQLLAIADYDDRFVIPTKHNEDTGISPYVERGMAGFDEAGTPGRRGVFHQGHVKELDEGGD